MCDASGDGKRGGCIECRSRVATAQEEEGVASTTKERKQTKTTNQSDLLVLYFFFLGGGELRVDLFVDFWSFQLSC